MYSLRIQIWPEYMYSSLFRIHLNTSEYIVFFKYILNTFKYILGKKLPQSREEFTPLPVTVGVELYTRNAAT